ncbi:MAG: hypothetical protein KJ927_08800, partial [Candidatus Eisenbacteria bacterium]|nr:hypothetical protein [Candidatus Eisenbacteria bacterium]
MPSNSRFHQILIGVILGLISCSPAQAFRVMTYNLLNYSSGREAEFRTVLEQAEPDILVAEEILSQVAVDYFLANVLDVLDPGEWEAGDFVNGADTDNAIFYRSTKVSYIGHHVIGTTLRDIDEWTVGPVGYGSDASNLRIYALHLKASEGSDNEQRRLDEVTAMRTRMESFPPGQNYIVMGDFNIYDSGEPAYQYMLDTASGIAGVVQDPIDSPGNWHDGSSFAVIHSQSTRTIQFGGGASGGMDDRFDMILVGPAVQDDEGLDILEQTYATFGNDGQHFNKALIDDPPHPELPTEVIEALYNGSDHLPVIADLQVPPILLTDSALEFGSVIVGGTATRVLS